MQQGNYIEKKKKNVSIFKTVICMICRCLSTQEKKQEEEECLILESNPLEWTVTDVVKFIKSTDCAALAKIFQEQVHQSLLWKN